MSGQGKKVDLESVANFFLEEGFLLTALELHAELCERGKGLRLLANFFEDASNFEKFTRKPQEPPPSPCMSGGGSSCEVRRGGGGYGGYSGSQVTLDDLSRYSDAANCESDRVAVLEFELRRARQNIEHLRAELTRKATQNKLLGDFEDKFDGQADEAANGKKGLETTSGREAAVEEDQDEEEREEMELAGHERRTLNYLVNEYLLRRGYKLTAITFSDENADEDFEDWDSIGLNVAKPPSLLRLYRLSGGLGKPGKSYDPPTVVTSSETQTDIIESDLTNLRLDLKARDESLARLELTLDNRETEVVTANCLVEELRHKVSQLEAALEEAASSVDKRRSNEDLDQTDTPQATGAAELNDVPEVPNESPSFVKYIYDRCLPLRFDEVNLDKVAPLVQDIESEEISNTGFHLQSVIDTITESLPKIAPNVILAKRDELIPLLLVIIQIHPEVTVRDQFLNLLFNLIKRPDSDQRAMILRGFLAIATKFGPRRIEAELLPQCWEQISHKYEERRLLVAETCGLLCPYVPCPLRGSLLLSMLHQLALEEKETTVREAAAKSLAVLVLFLQDLEEDQQKRLFDSIWQLTGVLLKDTDSSLVQVTQTTLLVSVANWALTLGQLEGKVATDRICEFLKYCELSEDSTARVAAASHLEGLRLMWPMLAYSIVKTSPQLSEQIKALDLDNTCSGKEASTCSSLSLETLLGSKSKSDKVVKALQDFLNREWFEPWPQIQWMANYFFRQLSAAISHVPVEVEIAGGSCFLVNSLIDFLSEDIVGVLGATFTMKHLGKLLKQETSDVNLQNQADGESATRAVYALGLLRHTQSPSEVCATVKRWLLIQSTVSDRRSRVMDRVVRGLILEEKFREPLAQLALGTLMAHERAGVRCAAARVMETLAEQGEDRILSGLVTLASTSSEPIVRASAARGLALCMANSTDASAREEARMQFVEHYFSDERGHEAYVAAVEAVAEVWSMLETRPREDTILPGLAEIYSRYGTDETQFLITNERERAEMCAALARTYAAVCAKPLAYPRNLTPVLSKLMADARQLGKAQLVSEAERMILGLEEAYGTAHSATVISGKDAPSSAVLSPSSPYSLSLASKMSSSPSLDDMKQKMGRLLLKKPSAPTQFWKK